MEEGPPPRTEWEAEKREQEDTELGWEGENLVSHSAGSPLSKKMALIFLLS